MAKPWHQPCEACGRVLYTRGSRCLTCTTMQANADARAIDRAALIALAVVMVLWLVFCWGS